MESNELISAADTICAISTPPGVGGIAVARVSGPRAIEIVDTVWRGKRLAGCKSHTVHLGILTDTRGEDLDQAVAAVFKGPASFTGEDVVELSVHGSRWIQRELIATLCQAGCRLAEPGEFTRRAFMSGRIDLVEAEGIADMIASDSRAAHRAASCQMRGHYSARIGQMRDKLVELASLLELELDFSEEEVEFASRRQLSALADELYRSLVKLRDSFAAGVAIKEGIPVAIVGPTNAGKSSLLNAITGDDRAIVSDIHGTTRDIVDDLVEIGDYQYRFQDTAGLRETSDAIERIGIERSLKALAHAHTIIYIVDLTDPETAIADMPAIVDRNPEADLLVLLNKTDLVSEDQARQIAAKVSVVMPRATVVPLSTRNQEDIDRLKGHLTSLADSHNPGQDLIVTNARHAQAFARAAESAHRTINALQDGLSGDLIAQDVRETIHHLSAITGVDAITTDTLLSTIFTRFCIGK
ncbi:MAG: tRNA uridine-5-carboxymethylaminomethyl(34) synthesis GTPase MnmE [Muribaculaceae bacterium]|nr:tRNA uridine-5-carboxymethylaminomethyl(34) synthesis GTPase MnmE [Muribaculaceae bacterium]